MGSSRQFRGPLIGPLTRSTCGWSAARCERGDRGGYGGGGGGH
jgi:hypothetical protein